MQHISSGTYVTMRGTTIETLDCLNTLIGTIRKKPTRMTSGIGVFRAQEVYKTLDKILEILFQASEDRWNRESPPTLIQT